METTQRTTRRLVAFSAVVLLCGAVPHYRWDGTAHAVRVPSPAGEISAESLLPSMIGRFHIVDRWKSSLANNIVEHGGIYRDEKDNVIAQIALRINNPGTHNGLKCYLVRGVPLERQFLERATAADSSGDFNIAFLKDQSLTGTEQTDLLFATTECGTQGCTEAPIQRSEGIHLGWREADPNRATLEDRFIVPLSVTLQSAGEWSQERALQQFRELMSNFKLLPLRNASAAK